MHYKIQQNKINKILFQRNIAMLIIAGLLIISFSQVCVIYKLLNKKQINFIPLPPVLSAPFSISQDKISSGYLAEMSRYFAMLRLNYNPSSFAEQRQILLNYIDAKFYSEFKQELILEETQAKANEISISFMPSETEVFEKNLAVLIKGDLIRYVGKVKLNTEQITYKITYKYHDGVLKVTGMLKIEAKNV